MQSGKTGICKVWYRGFTAPLLALGLASCAGVTARSNLSTVPTPALSALSPASASAGSGDLPIVVTGSNYNGQTVVEWNGGSLATAMISATELHASVPASDLASAGTAQVKVTNGHTNSNALNFTIVASGPPLPPGACDPPHYCAYTGTDLQPYSGVQNQPPALNQSFFDPTFNRKIWRITDATTWNGLSFNPAWSAGYFPGVFNTTQTLMLLANSSGGNLMFTANLSNPNAPSVIPTSCSYNDGTCQSGKIVVNAGFGPSSFSGVSPYLVWGWSGNGALVKMDFTNTISSGGKTAPVRTTVFDPYSTGKCLAGLSPSQGFIQMDPTDTYFWGEGSTSGRGVYYKSGADCKYVDTSVSPWVVGGDSTWGGAVGPVTTVDGSGNPIANFQACGIHGSTYDATANVIKYVTAICADTHFYILYLDLNNLKLELCSRDNGGSNNCSGGHSLGILNTGTATGEVNPEFAFGETLSFWFIPSAPPHASNSSDTGVISPALGTNGSSIDYHPNGAYNLAGFPLLGALGFFNVNGALYAPPKSSMNVTMPYEGEMIVYRADDLSKNTMTLYRFAHNYTAAGNYNSQAGQYGWGVMTAFSPDHKWVVWSSNWLGNLGDFTKTPPTTPCTSAAPQHCRHDTFMIYLAGGTGT